MKVRSTSKEPITILRSWSPEEESERREWMAEVKGRAIITKVRRDQGVED